MEMCIHILDNVFRSLKCVSCGRRSLGQRSQLKSPPPRQDPPSLGRLDPSWKIGLSDQGGKLDRPLGPAPAWLASKTAGDGVVQFGKARTRL